MNIKDISRSFILTNDGKCYRYKDVKDMVDENVDKLINDNFYKLKNGDVLGGWWRMPKINLGKNIVSAYDIATSLDPPESTTIYLDIDGTLIKDDEILINERVKDFYVSEDPNGDLFIIYLDNKNNLYGLDVDFNKIILLGKSIKKIIDYEYVIDMNGNLIEDFQERNEIIAENVKDAYVNTSKVGILIRQFAPLL